MVLKGRLKLIYDMIPPCDTLADIGTDHALLPAYALLNKRCRKAIACDVRTGPLERAERTLRQYSLQEHMELRLGSGLEPLKPHEADCVVLAGMGGILMTELLEKSLETARQAKHLILQPMVGQETVRPFLWKRGFEVVEEGLVSEDTKLYQVLRIQYTGVERQDWDILHEVIGELLIKMEHPLLPLWVKDRLKRQEKIVKGLLAARSGHEALQREKLLLHKLAELLDKIGQLTVRRYGG